jgi:hypothetical protein
MATKLWRCYCQELHCFTVKSGGLCKKKCLKLPETFYAHFIVIELISLPWPSKVPGNTLNAFISPIIHIFHNLIKWVLFEKKMSLVKKKNLSKDMQLVNRSSGNPTQIQVVHAMDRIK